MPDPINPEAIAAMPGIHHSFQADRDFQSIHASSVRAQELLETSRNVLGVTADMTEKTGLGMIFRMQITTPDGHLIFFSLNPQKQHAPGPRLFGFETDPTVQIDQLAASINQLL